MRTTMKHTRDSIVAIICECRKNGTDIVLRRADLSGLDLRGLDLRDADLRRANLQEANLQEADLLKRIAFHNHHICDLTCL